MFDDQTIIAQASAHGVGRRGILRLSGSRALDAVAPFFSKRAPNEEFPPEGEIAPQSPIDDETRPQIVDGWFAPWGAERPIRRVRCALFFWPTGRGYTGEEAVELHLPGSPAILDAAQRAIISTGHARMATRGEFTLRAFLAGRLDLTQAEAVLGAIDATSDRELQTALTQLSGSLSAEFSELRNRLLDALSDLEAGFDFVDEDIEFISKSRLIATLREIRESLIDASSRARGRLGRDREPRALLVGKPNVGKSSLYNRLSSEYSTAERANAIVSDASGTTRDYLETSLTVDGLRFTLVDAAGLDAEEIDPDSDAPAALAQRALFAQIDEAALIVRCFDEEETRTALSTLDDKKPTLDVLTKSDLNGAELPDDALATSATTGDGVIELGLTIATRLREEMDGGEIVASTALRCQDALRGAIEALDVALELLTEEGTSDDFLVASELRVALDQIGLVSGQVHTEDLLDRIFSRFCVGK